MRVGVNDPRMAANSPERMSEVFREINRHENINYLLHSLQGGDVAMIRNAHTNQRQVYLPSLHIRFDYPILEDFPLRFRAFVDALLLRAAEERSRAYNQPKVVKPVSQDHGKQYFITPKLLDGAKCENNCSICLEPLLPEGKRRKKIWKLGCDCQFHIGCVKRWFKEDSRCPNCRQDCAE